MSGDSTYQGLERLTHMPTRTGEQGDRIAGQFYYDVDFTGGLISNVTLLNCTFDPPVSGGGSFISTEQIIASGSTATAIASQFIGFNSASGTAKSCSIPTSTASLNIIVVADLFGDAYTNNITVTPVSGSIKGENVVYTNKGSLTFLDSSIGWVSI